MWLDFCTSCCMFMFLSGCLIENTPNSWWGSSPWPRWPINNSSWPWSVVSFAPLVSSRFFAGQVWKQELSRIRRMYYCIIAKIDSIIFTIMFPVLQEQKGWDGAISIVIGCSSLLLFSSILASAWRLSSILGSFGLIFLLSKKYHKLNNISGLQHQKV